MMWLLLWSWGFAAAVGFQAGQLVSEKRTLTVRVAVGVLLVSIVWPIVLGAVVFNE